MIVEELPPLPPLDRACQGAILRASSDDTDAARTDAARIKALGVEDGAAKEP